MTRILFACVENACRSQMAEGFAKQFGDEEIKVSSGGSDPVSEVNEKAIKVMEERDIDIASQAPSLMNPEEADAADLVVTMGCGPEACPVPVASKSRMWDIEDPAGKSLEKFREVRDEFEERVKELLQDIQKEKGSN